MTTTIKVTDSAGHATTKTIDLVLNSPATGPVYGMNLLHTQTGQVYENQAHAGRIYVAPGVTDIKTVVEFQRGYNLGIRKFVISWKDTSTSTLPALFDSFPDDVTWYGVTHHEPEDDISDFLAGKGGYSLAQWKSWQTTQLPIVRAHGGIPTICFMGWTLQSASGRNINDYVLPAGLVDVVLYDFYPGSNSVQAGVVNSMKASRSIWGCNKYGIGEYGVVNSDPTNGVLFINTLKSLITDADIALYWSSQVVTNPPGQKPNWRFSDQTAAAWFA